MTSEKSKFKSPVWYKLNPLRPLADHFISLIFSYLTCKVGIMMICTWWDDSEDEITPVRSLAQYVM